MENDYLLFYPHCHHRYRRFCSATVLQCYSAAVKINTRVSLEQLRRSASHENRILFTLHNVGFQNQDRI